MNKFERLRCARISTTILFLAFGFWVGVWVSAIPGLKNAFHLDARQLGVVIFLSGVGDLGMAIPMGKIIDIVGPKLILINTGCVSSLLYAALPWMATRGWSAYLVIFCLSTYSCGGVIAANHRATELEAQWGGRPIMSSFHAAFSVGGVLGSATYALLLRMGWSYSQAYPALAIFVAAVNFAAASCMDRGFARTEGSQSSGSPVNILFEALASPKAARREPLGFAILCLGCVCFLTMMTEGAIGDWSSLYFIEEVGTPTYRAPLGYSVYATAMGALRFLGDELIDLYGRRKVFRLGALTAMTGIALLLAVPSFELGLLGCALTGVGMSNMMPIVMSSSGRMAKGNNTGVIIATMSVMGQFGLMGGPCVIGFIAHETHSLRGALCTLLVTTSLILSATPLIKELYKHSVRPQRITQDIPQMNCALLLPPPIEHPAERFESAKEHTACEEDHTTDPNPASNDASSPEFASVVNHPIGHYRV